jgi:Trp operon repressor
VEGVAMKNKNIQSLMQKEMSRKEFLATMGFGVAAVMGASTLIKLLTGKSNPVSKQLSLDSSKAGYGSGSYCG